MVSRRRNQVATARPPRIPTSVPSAMLEWLVSSLHHIGAGFSRAQDDRGGYYLIESPRAPPGGCGGGLTSAPRAAWSKVPRSPGCRRQSRNAIDPIPSTLPIVEVSQGNRLSVRE